MKQHDDNLMTPALSFPVEVRSMPQKGMQLRLDTDEKERAQLAANHGLLGVDLFHAEFQLAPWKKRGVRVKGYLKADIRQACVVTLEPVSDQIEQTFEVVYVPEDSKLIKPLHHDETGEVFLDYDGMDSPEIFSGDRIDVGAIAEEFFELSINPYPRQEGVEMPKTYEGDVKDSGKVTPFAALKDLKKS